VPGGTVEKEQKVGRGDDLGLGDLDGRKRYLSFFRKYMKYESKRIRSKRRNTSIKRLLRRLFWDFSS
jgi:hypothetical protein